MGARVLVVDDSPTIRRLVRPIPERHNYEPAMAADGFAGLERLRKGDVDLVLLDFVMPKMNGYQFCREMRADEKISHLPVVLMDAKGSKIRGHFVQQTGAVDAITKPFDARGLLAVVENALHRAAEGRIRHLDSIPIEEDVALSDLEDRGSGTVAAAEDISSQDNAVGLANKLASIVVAAMTTIPEPRRKDPEEIAASIRKVLADGALDELGPWLVGLSESAESFGGQMQVIPLAEVLQVLQLQRQTGTCRITNGKVEVTVSFREGLVDLARGKGAADEFRLGRYLIEEGLVTRDELNIILKKHEHGNKRLLGEALINFGLIGDEDLRRALIRQTSELLYDVLRWPKGRFTFSKTVMDREQAEPVRLGLPVASIVMEGIRRVDEWRIIEESIHFDE